MRAVRIERPGELRLVDVARPEPAPGEVVVDVAFAGICGSDVEMLAGRRPAPIVRYPVIPGHEWSGVVARLGDGVDGALLGRNVVGEGFRSCHGCGPCARGDAVLCETTYDEIGFTRPGAWAEQLVLRAEQLHVLPDGADLRAAAGLEPAACSADAVRRADVQPGQRVAVVGCGTIGALAVQLLRATGAREIVVVEPDRHRAVVAERCGATTVVTPEAARAFAGSVDVVIEAAGAPAAARLAVELARRGGRVVLAGIAGSPAPIDAVDLVTKRLEVRAVFGAPSAAWAAAVAAFERGVLDPGLVVTHELDLADASQAFALLTDRSVAVGKVLLRP